MAAHLDDLEERLDALDARIERQEKLIERITLNLYDVVDAVVKAQERLAAVAEHAHVPEAALPADDAVVDFTAYARAKAHGG
jgi:uncharacterized coiled-coil protein SlyX